MKIIKYTTAFLITIAFLASTPESAYSKTSKKTKLTKEQTEKNKLMTLGYSEIVIKGRYKKHDKDFVYISSPGAKKLVKVSRKFLNSSPKNFTKNQELRVELPLARVLLDNRTPASKN
jgi:hypothetical protein